MFNFFWKDGKLTKANHWNNSRNHGSFEWQQIDQKYRHRFCKRKKLFMLNSGLNIVGYRAHNKVFTTEQEEIVSSYLTMAANIYFRLTPTNVRNLAFELAVVNIVAPKSWTQNRMAGIDWFKLFMMQNPQLAIRKPQATSLGRAMNFNRPNGNLFYR